MTDEPSSQPPGDEPASAKPPTAEPSTAEPAGHLPRVRQLPDVPVFNCHVYLAPPDASGTIHVRASALPEVVASGTSDRDALRNIVAVFKQVVSRHLAAGEPIPWLDPPSPPLPEEKQRWVPVHF